MRILLAFTLTAAVCLAAAPFKVAHKAPLKAKVIETEKVAYDASGKTSSKYDEKGKQGGRGLRQTASGSSFKCPTLF